MVLVPRVHAHVSKIRRGLLPTCIELLHDPAIRLWVILPIILITLMTGLVRHYVTILLKSDRQPDLKELRDRLVDSVEHK